MVKRLCYKGIMNLKEHGLKDTVRKVKGYLLKQKANKSYTVPKITDQERN